MKPGRYVSLLLALMPAFTLAQEVPDSLHVEVAGVAYPAYGAVFGARFSADMSLGPLPIVRVEGTGETAPPSEGCDPLVNADEVAGNIAFIRRGRCSFVDKVENALAAGAIAVVVYNDAFEPDNEFILPMAGDCEPDICSIPSAFVSRVSGDAILEEIAAGPTDATLIPIRIASPVTVEEDTEARAFVLHPVYPNPLASHATVVINLPTAQAVRVAVFDLLGREVAVLHDGSLPAGPHTLTLDATRLPAGLYLVRATGAGHRATRKLMITR
ncbi:MAG: PA domain-containing protein [Rhodothermales bacterium]